MKPVHKYNGGLSATLCNKCRVIIAREHTDDLLCNDCKQLSDNQVLYSNRYNDKIIFTDNGDEVEMTGYNPDWMRCGYVNNPDGSSTMNTDNQIIGMVDPSGGPYISLGDNLKSFFNDEKDRIVKAIKIHSDKVIFKL